MGDGKARKKGKPVLEKRRIKHERRAKRDAANHRRDLVDGRS
ncbi:hypothetical protein BH10ACT1_BH10ACT1_03270 [soil metagenome]